MPLAICLVSFFVLAAASPLFAQPMPVRQSIQSAATWLESQQHPDFSFGDVVPMRDTPVVVESLLASGPTANTAADWLRSQECSNNDYLARKIRACALAGDTPSGTLEALISFQNADGGFGLSADYESDGLDTLLALDALTAANAQPVAQVQAADYLVRSKNTDGGWGLGQGQESSVWMTSQVLAALSRFRSEAKAVSWSLEVALRGGSAWLAARQTPDGSFGDRVYQTALSYLALRATEATFDVRSAVQSVLAKQDGDGSFGGDIYDTALCLEVLREADIDLTLDSVAARALGASRSAACDGPCLRP